MTLDVSDVVDELTDEQRMICFSRALRKHGIEHEMRDGRIDITDEDIYNLDGLAEDPELSELFSLELRTVAADKVIHSLWERGLIEPNSVGDDGEIGYVLAEGVTV